MLHQTQHSLRHAACALAAPFLIAAWPLSATAAEDYASMPTLIIDVQETANLQPVSTYETPISNLEFEPRVDLQSRNMAEAQGDVSIRGGIFENTGFRVGAATLIDPQTGHYFAELPIAPEMLNGPNVLTGVDNALYGFNSTVGTLDYGWSEIVDGGSLTAGGGDNGLNFQRFHQGLTRKFNADSDWSWGAEAEYSRSESDGTIKDGDHDFYRTSGRVQLVGPNSQTDFFAGYQAKAFGWPNMYTPYGNETENLKTRLFVLNHEQDYGDNSQWELSAYHRRHSDHYFLDAFGGIALKHETRVTSLALSGHHTLSERTALNYALQASGDEIDSTSLEQGPFTSRTAYKISLLPEYRIPLENDQSLTFRAGASLDDTNRDSSEVSPIFDITWKAEHANGDSERAYLSFAQTSQVPGYTAIGGSETSGLFRSNHDLGREVSQNLELGFSIERSQWSLESAVFYREDNDLVDWTYTGTSARSAANVDIETLGLELIATRQWGSVQGIASYTYLHKDEDYGTASVDASFYALNFPEHRSTLGLIWRPIDLLELRLDNEWRSQRSNTLRSGPDEALLTHLGLSLYPPQVEALEIFFAIDKPWDEDFQDVPGTPGRGDQYTAGATLRW